MTIVHGAYNTITQHITKAPLSPESTQWLLRWGILNTQGLIISQDPKLIEFLNQKQTR